MTIFIAALATRLFNNIRDAIALDPVEDGLATNLVNQQFNYLAVRPDCIFSFPVAALTI